MIFEIEENVTFEVLKSELSYKDGSYLIYFRVRETDKKWRLVCGENCYGEDCMKWEKLMPDSTYAEKGLPTIYGYNHQPLKEFFNYARNMKKLAEYELISRTIKKILNFE